MRFLLAIALFTSACAKKPAVKQPSATPVENKHHDDDTGAKDSNRADDADDAKAPDAKSDPCDGSE